MAFDTLLVKAAEGLLSFQIQSTIDRSTDSCLTLLVCECNGSSDLRAKSNKYIKSRWHCVIKRF